MVKLRRLVMRDAWVVTAACDGVFRQTWSPPSSSIISLDAQSRNLTQAGPTVTVSLPNYCCIGTLEFSSSIFLNRLVCGMSPGLSPMAVET